MIPKPRPWRSAKYRKFVASLPCCFCGHPHSNAHHEQEEGKGVMGGKCDDSRCIPLCTVHHFDRHRSGRSFWDHAYVGPEAHIIMTRNAWELEHGTRPWEPTI